MENTQENIPELGIGEVSLLLSCSCIVFAYTVHARFAVNCSFARPLRSSPLARCSCLRTSLMVRTGHPLSMALMRSRDNAETMSVTNSHTITAKRDGCFPEPQTCSALHTKVPERFAERLRDLYRGPRLQLLQTSQLTQIPTDDSITSNGR